MKKLSEQLKELQDRGTNGMDSYQLQGYIWSEELKALQKSGFVKVETHQFERSSIHNDAPFPVKKISF